MAGYIHNGIAIDYHDGEGSCIINGRKYQWEFHEYGGPTFTRDDGEPLKRQPGPNHPVWNQFEEWLKKYHAARKTAKSYQVVVINPEYKWPNACVCEIDKLKEQLESIVKQIYDCEAFEGDWEKAQHLRDLHAAITNIINNPPAQ